MARAAVAVDLELVGGEEEFAGVEVGLEGGEEGVAGGFDVHAGEEDFGAAGEEGGVEFGAADEVEVFFGGRLGDFVEAGNDSDAGDFGRSREDPIFTAGEGFSNRVVSFSAHEDDVAEGGAFEKLEVGGEVPGDASVEADGAVAGHGGDADHTAMGALMAGWGS